MFVVQLNFHFDLIEIPRPRAAPVLPQIINRLYSRSILFFFLPLVCPTTQNFITFHYFIILCETFEFTSCPKFRFSDLDKSLQNIHPKFIDSRHCTNTFDISPTTAILKAERGHYQRDTRMKKYLKQQQKHYNYYSVST